MLSERRKRWLIILVALCIVLVIGGGAYMISANSIKPVSGPVEDYGLEFEIDSGNYGYGVYVTGCDERDIVIPSSIEGEQVLSVSLPDQALDSIDLSEADSLVYLNCAGGAAVGGNLQNLDVSACSKLQVLYCQGNKLLSLSLPQESSLNRLDCSNNFLTNSDELDTAAKGVLRYSVTMPQFDLIDVSKLDIELANQTYSGVALEPQISVESNGIELECGVDFKATFKHNKKVGMAQVTIVGMGICTGEAVTYFEIDPVPVSLKTCTLDNGVAHIAWNRPSFDLLVQLDGYEVQISTDADFSADKTRSKTIRNSAKQRARLDVSELSGNGYFVRIRSFRVSKGVTYYSGWSDAEPCTR